MHQNGGSGEKVARAWLAPVFFVPALALAAAHVWRAGQAGEAAAIILWALMCLRRRAWMRPLTAALLLLLAGEWLVTTQSLMEMRVAMGRPWTRLAVILLAVTAFTAGAALLTSAKAGRAWFCRGRERGLMQAAAFLLAFAPLFGMARFAPQLMLVHRLAPGFGVMQALAAGCWSAWVCARLADRTKAGRTRLFAWRLFSVVFFAQFFLSLAGWSLFSMTGEWHIPVPGVIVAGALYRGTAGFMPLLFAVSVLVLGAAWCSHLCYFGSWDAWAASRAKPSPHPGPLRWRVLSLLLVCLAALALRRFASLPAAVACGAALGLVMIPAAFFVSRRRGWAAYCTLICPLGLLSCLAGRLSPWRVRRSSTCTLCGACTRVCRYGALTKERLEAGGPGLSCTLCRDCLNVCPRGGLTMTCAGHGAGGRAEKAFVVLACALHALFLFSAMV